MLMNIRKYLYIPFKKTGKQSVIYAFSIMFSLYWMEMKFLFFPLIGSIPLSVNENVDI
jgi:hypothetical protein